MAKLAVLDNDLRIYVDGREVGRVFRHAGQFEAALVVGAGYEPACSLSFRDPVSAARFVAKRVGAVLKEAKKNVGVLKEAKKNPPPSKQLLAALHELQALVKDYDEFYDRAQLIEVAHNAGVLAEHEGFEELSFWLIDAKGENAVEEALRHWPVDLKIHITYERWNEEALEAGETDDVGFYEPGGWYYNMKGPEFRAREREIGTRKAMDEWAPEPAKFNDLEEAVLYVTSKGAISDDAGGYFFTEDLRYTTIDNNYDVDGDRTSYTYHVEGDPESRLALHERVRSYLKSGWVL